MYQYLSKFTATYPDETAQKRVFTMFS